MTLSLINLGKIWLSLVHAISTRETILTLLFKVSLEASTIFPLHCISVYFHFMDDLRVHSKYSWHCPGYQHSQTMENIMSMMDLVPRRTRSSTGHVACGKMVLKPEDLEISAAIWDSVFARRGAIVMNYRSRDRVLWCWTLMYEMLNFDYLSCYAPWHTEHGNTEKKHNRRCSGDILRASPHQVFVVEL